MVDDMVSKINSKVDLAVDLLNCIRSRDEINYSDYSKLHDYISDISIFDCGSWNNVEPGMWDTAYATCSCCGTRLSMDNKVKYNYCPVCGSCMMDSENINYISTPDWLKDSDEE